MSPLGCDVQSNARPSKLRSDDHKRGRAVRVTPLLARKHLQTFAALVPRRRVGVSAHLWVLAVCVRVRVCVGMSLL